MNGKILIIDDDPSHLIYTQEILEADGHQVTVNRGGFGATLKILKERPDVVLLDVNMPGLSGDTVAGLLQQCQKERGFDVYLYSSNDEESLRKAARSLGTSGFLMKGDPQVLRDTIRRAMAARAR